MNILITGGAGYIGSSLVERLNQNREVKKIVVFDNLSRSPLNFFIGSRVLRKVVFAKGDILDSYAVEAAVKDIDVIYHLAAFVDQPFNYSQNIQYEQVNQWGTLNMVRCLENRKHSVRKVIYLSSASVYEAKNDVSMTDLPQPSNPYGASKLAGENFFLLLKDYIDVRVIRSSNVFGFNNSVRLDSVINNFIFHSIVDKRILIHGKGSQYRPFISLRQLVSKLCDEIYSDINNNIPKLLINFNANINEITDWLLETYVPDMEYSYLNQNIEYSGQSFIQGDMLSESISILNEEYGIFKESIRIRI